ncbi:MAG: signal peptidase [Pseudonocardiales bacterium]|jgi:lipoprotein signal peptidase|nr:signal peptidase [Pseudonocardiales bacterium]
MAGHVVGTVDRPARPLRIRSLASVRRKVGQRLIVLGVVAAIVVLDQSIKWWAWRNASGVRINYGGDVLAPAVVAKWYRGPVAGALLDALGSGLLITAGSLFVRSRRPIPVLIAGALVIGGWSSDILDRVVMHYWTAPGSVRGVVDFIPIGPHYYNVADLLIIGGTPMFVLAVAGSALRRFVMRRAGTRQVTSRTHRPRWARMLTLVVATAIVMAAISGIDAATFGGVTAPVPSAASVSDQAWHITHRGSFIPI